ncbi:hypothetical protein GIB67_015112 [Kingdonia uniflora]|uniref:Uncharacterized protein n=1 Tax=Kingdonia uniflora TaxID=39325 RepID=A0A7J7LIY5_9MAGN|nr:hypothetical protein GIB67_015112 [Kingdonia uniflora]
MNNDPGVRYKVLKKNNKDSSSTVIYSNIKLFLATQDQVISFMLTSFVKDYFFRCFCFCKPN